MKENGVAESDLNLPVIEMVNTAVASLSRPEVVLIAGINWTVSIRDCWVVGGLPGSGKSDLLSTAAGLMRPHSGTYRLFDREIWELPEEEQVQTRLRAGLVFANEGRLFSQLTVAENLALPICYHRNCRLGAAQDRVRAILEFTGLASLAHSTPGTISRNMRLRAGLARALALDPELLLLDNPLRSMDSREMRWWLDFLGELRAGHEVMNGRKMTLIIAVDDFRPWMEHGEKFALLKNEQWLFLGGRSDLRTHEEPLLHELLSGRFVGD